MTWLTLKAKLWAFAAAAVGIVGLILRNRYLAGKAERATNRAEAAEAGLRFRKAVDDADTEIAAEFSDLRERAKEDKADGTIPEHLRRSNDF